MKKLSELTDGEITAKIIEVIKKADIGNEIIKLELDEEERRLTLVLRDDEIEGCYPIIGIVTTICHTDYFEDEE